MDNSDVWDPGPIASCNCHCVGEMSYKWRRCCQEVQCLTLGLTSILSTPDVRLYVCINLLSVIVIGIDVSLSHSQIHMSAGAMITWFMPMLLAALVAKCPQSSDCSWNAFSRCDQIHTTRNISISMKSWSSMRKTRT